MAMLSRVSAVQIIFAASDGAVPGEPGAMVEPSGIVIPGVIAAAPVAAPSGLAEACDVAVPDDVPE
ncbi:hypothetical protein GCM10011492_22580 [Flexivirga endophytica]|uniref:Uncharacterized protein n=1 Tax=Flexivirga endophytica TaxID=1849103 RepID=A0A916T5Z1_9MICO|nr:hypothetical protein GCM10011492_22580 [Flexivirga endophytica]GHB52380.1 hypothetical protein GCM10008112_21850 [Flexivirga endophytica]